MPEITKVKTANREGWKALRRRYIGGSDAAAVVGMNAYVSLYSLWAEKTGRLPGFSGNLATEVGTYLEDFVARKFAEVTGKKVRRANHSFFNSDYPWAIANIDREIIGEDAGLEIKTTDTMNLKKFRGGEYPANYYVQSVHYLAVTGRQRWYLAVLIGNREFRWYTIERDEAEIAALMTAEADFWEHVKTGTPPEIAGSSSTPAALTALHPDSDESTVDLFCLAAELDRYTDIGQNIKALETDRNECANRIKAFMGDAGTGACDRYKVSWKTQTRRTFDSKRFASDHPDMDLSGYYKESTARAFRVMETKGD